MTACAICGKNEAFPFKCRYCSKMVCSDHRLPEVHDCVPKSQRKIYGKPSGGARDE
ncbi:MAG: AN1-type zinc finger protein [Nitrososphaerales archaeon]